MIIKHGKLLIVMIIIITIISVCGLSISQTVAAGRNCKLRFIAKVSNVVSIDLSFDQTKP